MRRFSNGSSINCTELAPGCEPGEDIARCRASAGASFATNTAAADAVRSTVHLDATYILAQISGFDAEAAYWIAAYTGSFWIAVVAGVAIAFVVGLLLENVFIRRLYGRDHLAQVLLSFGLILVIDEIRQLLFGKDVHSVLPPEGLRGAIQLTDNLSYPVYRLAICAFCLVAAAIIYLVITRTKIGMIVRAGAENREMTRTLGINFDTVNHYVFAVGIALAALGGIVVAPVSTVYPGMGDSMLILSFVVVVLGGIGSIGGAAIGALLIGLTDTFGKVFFPSVSSVLIYVLMAAVLLWRPNGILGRREL